MKICQVTAVGFTLCHFVVPLMAALRAKGHEVVGVCAPDSFDERVREQGFRVEPIPFSRSYDLLAHWAAYRALGALFRRERFDLVHVHTPIAALIARFAAFRADVPRIVYTAHGFYFHDRMPWAKRAPFIALEWLAGRVTHLLFTQSAEDAQTARRYGLCRGAIEWIGNGVDPARFHPANADESGPARLRRELATPEGASVILTAGRLVAEKGYPELFEAMRKVDAYLWVAGARLASDHADGLDAALRALDRDSGLKVRVRLLGHRRDMPELYRAVDIFTLPSHREGMPRSIIEAMMTGLPVVATDIRGSREEVVNNETGFLVPVGDGQALAQALGRLVRDPDLRRRFGAAGLARARALYDERIVLARQLDLLGLS
ncbi:MAG TPA: glycosyltransferase family 4 protein [Alphaproteobacteria bacterium]|nr:glycosyltransferase family 4 protein [Alphaproteobacteria bacterium]